MTPRDRRSFFLATVGSWMLGVLFAGLTVLAAWITRTEHKHDECLPGTCTIIGTQVQEEGHDRYAAILRLDARAPGDSPLGRYVLTLDAKGKTAEEAQAIADGQVRHQPQFACWYHPEDRDFMTVQPHGRWGLPAGLTLLCLLMTVGTFVVARWERRMRGPKPMRDLAPRWWTRSRIGRLYRARDFLPDEPPPGWSVPYALRDGDGWVLDAGEHGLLARLERTGGNWALRVHITTRGSQVPADDQRCAELLGHLDGLGEWLECVGVDGLPGTRAWLAIPRALQPHWEVPTAPPPPPADAIPRLKAAREHLPEKLPEGWSVPVAMVDPHGFDWPHGAWMFAADDVVVMLSLWDERGPMKLCVAMFHPDGSDVEEGDAFDVLRHLRGVHEFSPGKRAKDAPYIAYFGDLGPKERPRATLN